MFTVLEAESTVNWHEGRKNPDCLTKEDSMVKKLEHILALLHQQNSTVLNLQGKIRNLEEDCYHYHQAGVCRQRHTVV
jgi:hypothetical protein